MPAPRQRLRGVSTISDRPARIGKLKIGEIKETTKNGRTLTYPSKLDHIVAKDGAGNRIDVFHAVYGERPTEFRAVFPSNDPNDWYWEAYRRYGSGAGLVCHGNGERAVLEETGESIDCPCQYAEGDRPTCKPVASLSLFLYEVPALGVYQIDTGSINSIRNIRWFLHALRGLTGGQYAGIPFRVYIEPFQALHEGKASTAYAWKMDLLPGYRPQDLRQAAEQAVENFLLPAELTERPMLDEAKPEELYPDELPAAQEEASVPEAEACPAPADHKGAIIGIPGDWAEAVIAAENAYKKALEGVDFPRAKLDAKLAQIDRARTKAEQSQNWQGYIDWLRDSLTSLNAAQAEGRLV